MRSRLVRDVKELLPGVSAGLVAAYAALLGAPSGAGGSDRPSVPAVAKAPAARATTPNGPRVTAAMRADAASVVRILGQAPACGQLQDDPGIDVAILEVPGRRDRDGR